MTVSALEQLADAAGVAVHWQDAAGADKTVAPDVLQRILQALGLPAGSARQIQESRRHLVSQRQQCPPLITARTGTPVPIPGSSFKANTPYELVTEDGISTSGRLQADAAGAVLLPRVPQPGYHRLRVGRHEITLAVAPTQCTGVDDLAGHRSARLWGLSAQLYSLRRPPAESVGGIGDFGALAALARQAAQAGADALAISPVHAMFSADAARYSPYSPSSRLFLNVLYIDPREQFSAATIAAALRSLGMGERMLKLDCLDLIDWPQVATTRLTLLRALFDDFIAHGTPQQHEALARFREDGGEALERHARFEALHAVYLPQGASAWQAWPAALRDPAGSAVREFAARHAKAVRFHVFLQWLARRGLAAAQAAASEGGMRVGIIGDLAVGTDAGGSHAWSRQADIITGLSPGAPPDIYNPAGQSWGLTAFSPQALRQNGFQAFLETLRATLADVGGLRIDHALGLARMWLVPEGAPPGEGAYVAYPFDDMLRLVALESARHRALILGENLGTVPPGFNQRISDAGMLGMSVLWFERTGDQPAGFLPPQQWGRSNMATSSTHDLPTVAGWWHQRDLDWRSQLGLLGPTPEADQRAERERERQALWRAIQAAAHGDTQPHADAPAPTAAATAATPRAALAAQRNAALDGAADEAPAEPPLDEITAHLARSPSPLVLLPLEDLLGRLEQANLPGTIDTHPNWRRRLEVTTPSMIRASGPARRLRILSEARKRA